MGAAAIRVDGPERLDTALGDRGEDPSRAVETFDSGFDNLHDTGPGDGPPPLPGESGAWSGLRGSGAGAGGGGDDLGPGERMAAEIGLSEHLRGQLAVMTAPRVVSDIARALVDELDEHGYLRPTGEELAERYGAELPEIAAGIALLQACEPTGVGARSLAECLKLQLAERNRFDPAMGALLDGLDLLASGDHKRLRAFCGVDDEDYREMLAELRALDPRPCSDFGVEEPETLIPDVFVQRTDWNGWRVELNAETLPRVLVNRRYGVELAAGGGEEVRSFVSDCQANASWLIRSVDQRARTILRVTTEIFRRQEAFLDHGIGRLQPMTLRDVAETVNLHESTVSRVTSNKYVATNRGIFELKFFFSNAVGGGAEGAGISAEVIRHRIRDLVDAEPADAILSDDALVATLQSEGIDVARRTIAKYRKLLGIPSSVARRRQKSMTLRAG